LQISYQKNSVTDIKNRFMKKTLFIIAISAVVTLSSSAQQNHVPNPSFEDTIVGCPTTRAQITTRCAQWRAFTSGTPDYYHGCNTATNSAGVPSNFEGYQHAADGVAYAGIITYQVSSNYKEYIAAPITPLQIGTRYEVSMSVSLGDRSRFAIKDLAVFFYDAGPYTIANTVNYNVTPQIHYGNYGILADTANWVRLTKSFVADSAYDNIVIGSFTASTSLDTIQLHPSPSWPYANYYVDSVVIRILDSFSVGVNDTMQCSGDTMLVNYWTPNKFNSNNTFSAQLSDKTGSFANPINIGTRASDTSGIITCVIPGNISPGTGYRVRVISSSPADTTHNLSPSIRIGNPDSTNISVSSNSPLCEAFTLQFSASTFVSGTSYSWTGPNSFNSTSPNPFITGATPLQNGNYFVTMKWYGCEVTDTAQVTVKPLPAKPVATGNSPLCAGETLNLTAASSTSGVSYSWAGPASFTSSVQNPSISNTTTAMSGDYIVTANLNGCTTKDTATVTVNPQPAAVTLSTNPSPAGCTGDTLYLNSTASSTGVSYTWTRPNSFTANTQNASIPNTTTAATGWYKMTAALNSCSYVDSIYATINPIPATPIATYSSPLCIGETLGLAASTVSGATYTWNGPSNFSSNTQNPSRSNSSFSDTGTYTVTATVSGCTSPAASVRVGINPVPFVVIFATPSDSICQGGAVTFTALPNNAGGTPQYRWVVNGQTAGTNSTGFTTSTLNDQDVVRCDMTENTKCSSLYTDQSNDITMRVLPWLAPSVTISASPNRPLNVDEYVTFTATPTNAGPLPTYQWKRNGLDVQGATGSVWSANTLNDNDSISVEVFSNYKCPQPTTASSNGIRIRVLTSVNGLKEVNGLTLYPNPNNGKFVLKGNVADNVEYKIEIINALGQVVYKDNATANSGQLNKEIQLSNVANGIYLLRLHSETGITNIKFRIGW
jgi:hypothetical protein